MALGINISFGDTKPIREYKGSSKIIFPDNFVVVDIETTGFDTRYDSIIEVSAIKVHDCEITDTFSSLINQPDVDLKYYPEIIELTGITQDMLNNAPSEKTVITNFYNFVGDSIIIGHNVNFDINFLYDSLAELDINFANNFVDTLRFARRLLPELQHHRLSDIAQYFNIDTDGAHRALKDCEITFQCYNQLKELALKQYGDIENFAATWKHKHKYKLHAKDIVATNIEFDETHPLYNKVCVFTGVLEKMQRKDAMQIVAELGGICADGVTRKTNYLILGNNDYCSTIKDGKSSKQKKAEYLKSKGQDIDIISENTFYDMILDN